MVSEIAFACVLLVGAGLLVRSFLRVLDVNLGFRPERAAAVRVDPDARYRRRRSSNAYFDEVLRRVREIPGVKRAGLRPMRCRWGGTARGARRRRADLPRGQFPSAFVRMVSDGYYAAHGDSADEGRDISPTGCAEGDPVIVINETMARTLWPGRMRSAS